MKLWPMLMLAFALSGCATTRSSAPAADGQSEAASSEERGRLVCRKETVVGSHRKRRVCVREADRDRQRASDQENFGKSLSGTPALAD